MSKIMQNFIILKPEIDAGLDDSQCNEILSPEYQEWLDKQEPTQQQKETALLELTSNEPVF